MHTVLLCAETCFDRVHSSKHDQVFMLVRWTWRSTDEPLGHGLLCGWHRQLYWSTPVRGGETTAKSKCYWMQPHCDSCCAIGSVVPLTWFHCDLRLHVLHKTSSILYVSSQILWYFGDLFWALNMCVKDIVWHFQKYTLPCWALDERIDTTLMSVSVNMKLQQTG